MYNIMLIIGAKFFFYQIKVITMMMKSCDESVEINQNLNWCYIPDHAYRILIIGGSGSGKNNVLLNLMKNQWPDIDKIYLYLKDPFKSKYQLLTKRRLFTKK